MSLFIPKSTIDRILELPAHDVIAPYIEKGLKRSGASYQGLCPFHNEKTPSFNVSPARNMYKCFGCGEAGNAITFVMKKLRLTFPEAAEKICIDHRINIDAPSGNVTKRDATADDRDFSYRETPLNATVLQSIISKKVWEPATANPTEEDFNAHVAKVINTCKEYGLHALDEYSFVKEEEGKRHHVTIKSSPAMPVFMFEV